MENTDPILFQRVSLNVTCEHNSLSSDFQMQYVAVIKESLHVHLWTNYTLWVIFSQLNKCANEAGTLGLLAQ